jgi:hypothetical protein
MVMQAYKGAIAKAVIASTFDEQSLSPMPNVKRDEEHISLNMLDFCRH